MPQLIGAEGAGGFTASVTVDVPSGTEAGDVMVAWLSANAEDDLTGPAPGWVLLSRHQIGSGTAVWTYERVAEETDEALEADHTWTWGGSHHHHVIVSTWRGTAGVRSHAVASAEGVDEIDAPPAPALAGDALLLQGFHWGTNDSPEWEDPALTPVAAQSTILVAAYEALTESGPTDPYTLTAPAEGRMAAAAVVLAGQSEPIRANGLDGEDGDQVTPQSSGEHGNAFGAVDEGVAYSSVSYAGRGSLRLPSGQSSGTGAAWNAGLSLGDLAVRGYLRRDDTAQGGHIAWCNAIGGASLTTDGGITWSGISVPSGSVPADTWVRVEFRRTGDVGHVEVYADPQSLTPSASASGSVAEDSVVQWWFERFGAGGVYWDEVALADAGAPIGPIHLPESPVQHLGWGLPMLRL